MAVATNTTYDNAVLESIIEDQFNSHLDLTRFVTVKKDLVGTAGMTKKINRYTATDGTEQLAVGQGNEKTISAKYTPEEYKILLLQNRFHYNDEQIMEDPLVVETGLKHSATDMFNESNKLVFSEYLKTTNTIEGALNFDTFSDAVAQLNLPEDEKAAEAIEVFSFVNRKQASTIRKNAKEQLKYVEAFIRKGYVGTLANVNIYTKNDNPNDKVVVATRAAVDYYVKTGTEVEQVTKNSRSENAANTRENWVFSRKYFVPALVDETQCVLITQPAG